MLTEPTPLGDEHAPGRGMDGGILGTEVGKVVAMIKAGKYEGWREDANMVNSQRPAPERSQDIQPRTGSSALYLYHSSVLL